MNELEIAETVRMGSFLLIDWIKRFEIRRSVHHLRTEICFVLVLMERKVAVDSESFKLCVTQQQLRSLCELKEEDQHGQHDLTVLFILLISKKWSFCVIAGLNRPSPNGHWRSIRRTF
jgi:hypothetical protein